LVTNPGCGGGGDSGLTVEITSPRSTVYTRESVTVQVNVSGGIADRLELLRDGIPLVTLDVPYQYGWDTTTETEGEHELVARAFRGDEGYTSEARLVVVDRT